VKKTYFNWIERGEKEEEPFGVLGVNSAGRRSG